MWIVNSAGLAGALEIPLAPLRPAAQELAAHRDHLLRLCHALGCEVAWFRRFAWPALLDWERWVAGLPAPVVRQKLVNLPCFNIAAAGAILRGYLDEANGDLMQAIGYYHSHRPALGLPYRVRVRNAAAMLFSRTAVAGGPPAVQ